MQWISATVNQLSGVSHFQKIRKKKPAKNAGKATSVWKGKFQGTNMFKTKEHYLTGARKNVFALVQRTRRILATWEKSATEINCCFELEKLMGL
ncbi:hypothetical protein [Aliiglaciecola sp. LCG003]|uniref:hypothetical protein n=1 Tax=Aliiglaciecola sp. LCG003 TaxID=3053655 RepID=UPI0025741A67|nr:hypothetical protein [Aliiglaciecola sp. LCG003]WJG08111.1 hypothetical protein QR722_12250 [Aliiglaciecola sp. LCG003]